MTITAIYDGYCILCRQSKRLVEMLDWLGHVEFLDLHDADTISTRYPQLDHDALMGEINVVEREDTIYGGYEGVRRLLRELPLGWPLWLLLRLPGTERPGRWLYGWIARNRYRINRLLGMAWCEDDRCGLHSK